MIVFVRLPGALRGGIADLTQGCVNALTTVPREENLLLLLFELSDLTFTHFAIMTSSNEWIRVSAETVVPFIRDLRVTLATNDSGETGFGSFRTGIGSLLIIVALKLSQKCLL